MANIYVHEKKKFWSSFAYSFTCFLVSTFAAATQPPV